MGESRFKTAKRLPAPPGDIVRGLVTFRELGYVFQIQTGRGGEIYDVQAEQLLVNSMQFTDLVWQLHEKSWMSGQHFKDLFDCISEVVYRAHGVWPQVHYMVEGAINESPKDARMN